MDRELPVFPRERRLPRLLEHFVIHPSSLDCPQVSLPSPQLLTPFQSLLPPPPPPVSPSSSSRHHPPELAQGCQLAPSLKVFQPSRGQALPGTGPQQPLAAPISGKMRPSERWGGPTLHQGVQPVRCDCSLGDTGSAFRR